MSEHYDYELEMAREAGVEATYDLLNKRAAEARRAQMKPAPATPPASKPWGPPPPAAPKRPKPEPVSRTATDLIRLWAEHEQTRKDSLNPKGYERPSEMTGSTAAAQAWDYVRRVRGYDAAYPLLWWAFVRVPEQDEQASGKPAAFDAQRYWQLCGSQRFGQMAAVERLGWKGATKETILAAFYEGLAKRLKDSPFLEAKRVAAAGGLEIADEIVGRVDAAVGRRWKERGR